jgi:hypothetical protein
LDTISVSSLNGPNATKIQVPYRHVIEIQRVGGANHTQSGRAHQYEQQPDDSREQELVSRDNRGRVDAVEKSSSEMSFQEDIESLSKRLASISQTDGASEPTANKNHFDYKTVVANIQSVPAQPKQVIGAYNVRLEQNSPFRQRVVVKSDAGNSGQQMDASNNNNNNNDDDGEQYAKYHAIPALVDESALLTGKKPAGYSDDDDRLSQTSSCSLQSARTYKIRTIAPSVASGDDAQKEPTLNGDGGGPPDAAAGERAGQNDIEFDENGNNRRAAAWIYDPRDGSTTAIVPPARPKRPETPKVETEELVQARGGRSYYLEVLDTERPDQRATPNSYATKRNSMDSLYSRWNSQGALNTNTSPSTKPSFSYRPLTSVNGGQKPQTHHRSTKQLNSAIAQLEQSRNKLGQQQSTRRQLPFGGPASALGDKSKSSSCLLTVTKPTKYSIYGGFRKPGETNKPVPRLSYSRAIGPRSQRVDNLPKTPSRYLKMR